LCSKLIGIDSRLIGKFCRRRGGRGVGRENLFRNITIIVLNSEKRNPRSKAHVEILSRASWRIIVALCGLNDGTKKVIASEKRGTLHKKSSRSQ